MNPNVRRFEYSRLCTNIDDPRVYPVFDTHSNTEVARYDSEGEAQTFCDFQNTNAVEKAYKEKGSSTDLSGPVYVATPLIATDETDAALAKKYRFIGGEDYKTGLPLDRCHYDGMLKRWWIEGWKNAQVCDRQSKQWPLGND